MVKVRQSSTLPMTMAMTTTVSSSYIAAVDMIYFPSNFPVPHGAKDLKPTWKSTLQFNPERKPSPFRDRFPRKTYNPT